MNLHWEVGSWSLFDMALCFPIGTERKLLRLLKENLKKLLKLNKRRRWLHSPRVKLSLVGMSASGFFGVHISDVDFWFQVDSAEQPIKRSSVGSGHVSQCWTSPFHNHLDDSHFVFKKNVQQTRLRRMIVGVYVNHI